MRKEGPVAKEMSGIVSQNCNDSVSLINIVCSIVWKCCQCKKPK